MLCCWWADFVLPISAATGELLSFRSSSADTLQPLPLALVVPVLRCLCSAACATEPSRCRVRLLGRGEWLVSYSLLRQPPAACWLI